VVLSPAKAETNKARDPMAMPRAGKCFRMKDGDPEGEMREMARADSTSAVFIRV
jgi:hypothetical protein